VSGSLQGAGGVGGLIAETTTGTNAGTYMYHYVANGHILGLTDSQGNPAAEYEYGPFGEVIRASGAIAGVNPFQFSTTYTDSETDLNYYGFRYYNPSTGRWLSRDPIDEQGGANLYSICVNDPVGLIDCLGADFIAVGGRPLDTPLQAFGHLSLEYYKGCASEGTYFTKSTIPNNAHKTASVQLYPDNSTFGHYQTVYVPMPGKSPPLLQRRWEWDWISVIHFNDSTAVELQVIYSDVNEKNDTNQKWRSIMNAARSYGYAEQLPLGATLAHWPNSDYGFAIGDNSNTFVWAMASLINKSGHVLHGFYPGASSPKQVANRGYIPTRYVNH
jgi:RHS repeat-associated protein